MKTSRHFLRDERANTLLITALALIVLFASIGIGVDLGRQQLLRARMQQASDSAALAAASLPAGAKAEPVADRYFALNFPTDYMGFTPVTPSFHQDTTISVSTQGTMSTSMMGVAGTHSVHVGGTSIVDPGSGAVAQKYHLVLAMDNSYSMVFADAGGTTNTRPAGQVTIQGQKPLCRNFWQFWFPTYCPAANPDAYCSGTDVSCPSILPSPPNAANENGTINTSRLNALRYAATTINQQLLAIPNAVGNDIAATRWTQDTVGIPLAFTRDQNTVQDYLDSMYSPVNGATNSTAGLISANNLIQTVIQDCGNTAVCAVVLITDGMNTVADSSTYTCRADNSCGPDRFGCDGHTYCPQTASSSLPLCDQLKNSHVLVYTIAFGQDVSGTGTQAVNAQNFLSSCASGTAGANQNQFFFVAPDASALDDVFANIFTSIHKVRIVQ